MNVLYESDPDGRITDVLTYPTSFEGEADVSLNIVVMENRSPLHKILLDSISPRIYEPDKGNNTQKSEIFKLPRV